MERARATRLAQVISFRELTQRGLDLLADAPPGRRGRLEDVNALYAWLAQEMLELWSRWEQRNDART